MTDAQDRLADILAEHAEAMRGAAGTKEPPKRPRGPVLLPADQQVGYIAPILSQPRPRNGVRLASSTWRRYE